MKKILFLHIFALFITLTGCGNSYSHIDTDLNGTNNTIALIKDGWIYSIDYKGGNSLWKMKPDGSSKIKLNNDSSMYINIYDEWIYYVNPNDKSKLYKVKMDGSSATKVFNGEIGNYKIVGGYIYFKTRSLSDGSYVLVRIKADGSEVSQLDTGVAYDYGYINVEDNWVYYTKADNKLYKIKTDGSSKAKISDDSCDNVNVSGGWIYYCNTDDGGKIYKISTTGKNRTRLNNDSCSSINVAGEWIYYLNFPEKGKIEFCKMMINGRKRSKLIDFSERPKNISIAGDWIFYRGDGFYKMKADGTNMQRVIFS